MDERFFRTFRDVHQALERRGLFGMRFGGREQIGLQPNVEEDVVRVEAPCHVVPIRGGRMDAHQPVPDHGGGSRLGAPPTKLLLPVRKTLGRQIGHRQDAARLVLPQKLGHGRRHDRRRLAHPGGFVSVALDRRLPVRGDLEPGQRFLDANRAPARLDFPDVGRHAAAERRHRRAHARLQKAQAAQRGQHVVVGAQGGSCR